MPDGRVSLRAARPLTEQSGAADLVQCPGLDLAHSFPGDPELGGDLVERAPRSPQSKARAQDLALALAKIARQVA